MVTWPEAQAEFYRDGSLRDLYVLHTTMDDWQRTLDALRASDLRCQYLRAKRPEPVPRSAVDAFPEAGYADRLLRVDLGGLFANTHFFTDAEIEFDLDPREIHGQDHLDSVLAFMRLLASATEKEAILTPENQPGIVIFRARPGVTAVDHSPFGGYS